MSACRWCVKEYGGGRPEHFGSDPRCAFPNDGVFTSGNWACAGLNALRQAAFEAAVWSEDQNCAVLAFDGDFIVLSYYKNRGRTEGAWRIDQSECRRLTAADVEEWQTWMDARVLRDAQKKEGNQ